MSEKKIQIDQSTRLLYLFKTENSKTHEKVLIANFHATNYTLFNNLERGKPNVTTFNERRVF